MSSLIYMSIGMNPKIHNHKSITNWQNKLYIKKVINLTIIMNLVQISNILKNLPNNKRTSMTMIHRKLYQSSKKIK